MKTALGQENKSQIRAPARVLGCLQRANLAVIVCPENGFVNGGVVKVLPIELVPFDLRMPNSEFDVLFDVHSGNAKVLRKQIGEHDEHN